MNIEVEQQVDNDATSATVVADSVVARLSQLHSVPEDGFDDDKYDNDDDVQRDSHTEQSTLHSRHTSLILFPQIAGPVLQPTIGYRVINRSLL